MGSSFYYSDDAVLVDPTLVYTFGAVYFNGVPLQVDQDMLKEFVRKQM